MSKLTFKIKEGTVKIRIYKDEIQVQNVNPAVGIYYALPKKPTPAQLTDAASTVGLNYEDLGKLVAIVSSKQPCLTAESLGVECVLGVLP